MTAVDQFFPLSKTGVQPQCGFAFFYLPGIYQSGFCKKFDQIDLVMPDYA
jgi:hypothetical protein